MLRNKAVEHKFLLSYYSMGGSALLWVQLQEGGLWGAGTESEKERGILSVTTQF